MKLAEALHAFVREIGIAGEPARDAIVAKMLAGIEQGRTREGWPESVAVAVECVTVARAVRVAGPGQAKACADNPEAYR